MPAFTHLLDTSVYSQLIRPAMPTVVSARWQTVGHASMVVSSICEAELLYGIRKRGSTRLQDSYNSIAKDRYPVLPVNGDVAATYADLRVECERTGATVQDMDLLIAATAKTHNLTVATLTYGDFARIPGLAVDAWPQPSAS